MYTYYRDINSIVDDARRKGITFDVETLGLYRGQDMFSASYSKWGAKTPTTYWFDVSKSMPKASTFGKSAYEHMVNQYVKAHGAAPKTSTYEKFGRAFIRDLKTSPFLVGHNLTFDFGWLYENLPKREREELQWMISGTTDSRIKRLAALRKAGRKLTAEQLQELKLGKYTYGSISTGGGHVGALIRDAIADKTSNGFVGAYHKYREVISDSVTRGRVTVVDTNQLSRLFVGLAADSDLLGNRKAIGAKLELLSEALGIDTSVGAHTDMDVLYNQRLLDAFSRGDLDKMASYAQLKYNGKAKGRFSLGSLSEEGQQMVKMFKLLGGEVEGVDPFKGMGNVPYSSYTDFKFYHAVGQHYVDFKDTGKVPLKTKVGRKPTSTKSQKRVFKHLAGIYDKNVEDVEKAWNYYEDFFSKEHTVDGAKHRALNGSKINREAAEKILGNIEKNVYDSLKSHIRDYIKPREAPQYSTDFIPSGTLKEALTSKTAKRIGMYAAGAVAAATLWSSLSGGYGAPEPQRISSNDDDYNVIEGLHPGGGISKDMVQSLTDFGSGWKGGTSKAFNFIKEVGRNFGETLLEHSNYALIASMPGVLYGYNKGVEEGSISVGGFATAMAFDLADDALIFGAPYISKKFPAFDKVRGLLEHPYMEKASVSLFGFTAGKLLGEFIGSRISSNDDDYNTIEALHPGGGVNKSIIRSMTDFGSGYQGPNPQLNPEYNRAEDVYKYEWMRASKIGLSEEELYEYMTEESPEPSEYVAASANAGTALHEYIGSLDYKSGVAMDTERLILDHAHKISGHIDIIRNDLGVGDYKTVSGGIFDAIRKAGKPKPHHRSQVMFYLGQTGQQQGFIQYIDRDNINRQMTYTVKFDPNEYSRLIAKVERVRARVEADIASGRLDKSDLPKAAGPETLLKASRERPSPEEQIAELNERRRIYHEEMAYLNTVRRGMPHGGPGYHRIKKRNEQESTQGIGLQIYNNRNKHHAM